MGLLTESQSVVVLTDFATKLKERSINRSQDCAEVPKCSTYSPWHAAAILTAEGISARLLNVPGGRRLVTDSGFLDEVERYFLNSGRWILESLPVDPRRWEVLNQIEKSRADAISAFDDAEKLILCAPIVEYWYKILVDCVIPLESKRPLGFDTSYLRGAVFRAFPDGCTGEGVAFELAHATGHQLGILLSSTDIIISSGRSELINYKPRLENRTAIAAFYSTIALGFMLLLRNNLPNGHWVEKSDPYLLTFSKGLDVAFREANDSLRSQVKLTAIADELLSELHVICMKSP